MARTKPASGMLHSLPADINNRDYVKGIIRSVYEHHGFEALEGHGSFQAMIDLDNKSVEAKAILAVHEALDRLGVQNFAIYLSHSEVLDGILETVRVPAALQPQTFPAIRSFSKFDVEGFVSELQDVGVSENASTVLADLFLKTDEILNQESDINPTVVTNLLNIVNIDTLTELGGILRVTGRTPVLIDPALPCEPPFDPGIVIEARTSGLDILGEGGCINRADNQTVFVFSFDIENIVAVMEEGKIFPVNTAVPRSTVNPR